MKKSQDQDITTTKLVTPLNLREEKEKFFFDEKYNPQFEYIRDIPPELLTKYGDASDEYLPQAKKVLELVLEKWGSESKYLESVEGKILTKEETSKIIHTYLEENKLNKLVKTQYSYEVVSRTSMYKGTMTIRLPIEYREYSIYGMLNHEIGTHFLRSQNEQRQPWYNQKKQYGFQEYLPTEEGLASLHELLSVNEKYLWIKALDYYAVNLAQSLSFSELFKELRTFVDDRNRCWTRCVRVKRGLRDTSKNGAFSKDQVYFAGAILVGKWLMKNNYATEKLYLGKISISDLKKAEEIGIKENLLLPSFIQDKEIYAQEIQKILETNLLLEMCQK